MPYEKDEDLLREIGARLQQVRQDRGMTQQQLADALGIEVPTLSRYETGARPITLSRLNKAAGLLDVGLVQLIDMEAGDDPAFSDLAARWKMLDDHHRDLATRILKELVKAQ